MEAEWVRRGECNHCGWCCQYQSRSVAEVTNPKGLSDVEYYRTRGFQIHNVNGVPFAATIKVWHLAPCPQIADQRCGIYETRPRTCRDFPVRPEQVVGIPCSYWFENGSEKIGGQGSPFPTEG